MPFPTNGGGKEENEKLTSRDGFSSPRCGRDDGEDDARSLKRSYFLCLPHSLRRGRSRGRRLGGLASFAPPPLLLFYQPLSLARAHASKRPWNRSQRFRPHPTRHHLLSLASYAGALALHFPRMRLSPSFHPFAVIPSFGSNHRILPQQKAGQEKKQKQKMKSLPVSLR